MPVKAIQESPVRIIPLQILINEEAVVFAKISYQLFKNLNSNLVTGLC